MELFPAQPDLSLQISLPNSKPSSTWRRTSDEDSDDGPLNGFWKRALDSRNTTTTSAAGGGSGNGNGGSFDLSLSNPSSAAAAAVAAPQYYPNHHHFNNVNSSNSNFFRSSPNFPHQQHHNHHHQYQNLNHHHHSYQHHHHHQPAAAAATEEMGYLRPIKGIPLYQNPPPPSSSFHHYPSSTLDTISALAARGGQGGGGGGFVQQQPSSSSMMMRSSTRFMSRFPGKRSMRAPRMRWTTTLHGRFVHAVELLGGHERATPKSVLELMDVKDLTLAHVKSHLQMYRTVKTTDRVAATSGQSDLVDNGSSGDNSEDLMLDIHNTSSSSSRRPPEPCTMIQQQQGGIRTSTTTPSIGHPQDKDYHHHHNHHHQALWSNSSREAWLHGKTKDPPASLTSLEKEMDPKCMSYERISDGSCSSSQLSGSRSPQRPNLEFTLGRPH